MKTSKMIIILVLALCLPLAALADRLPVKSQNVNTRAGDDYYRCDISGMVTNESDKPLFLSNGLYVLTDSNGTPVEAGYYYPYPDSLKPGETAYFNATSFIDDDEELTSDIRVNLSPCKATVEDADIIRLPVSIEYGIEAFNEDTSESSTDGFLRYIDPIVTVTNNLTYPVRNIQLVTIVRDKDGRIMDCIYHGIDGGIVTPAGGILQHTSQIAVFVPGKPDTAETDGITVEVIAYMVSRG